jgi:DNA-binding NtrC family response regulator
MSDRPSPSDSFSSRAFLERAADPTFLLNARRRLRYANPAFEKLVKLSLADLYNLPCIRDRRVEPLGQTLAPPPEVMEGKVAVIRRPVPPSRLGPPWWDIAYMPLRSGDNQLWGIIGRVSVVAGDPGQRTRALPDGILQLRKRLFQRYSFSCLEGEASATHRLVEQVRLACQLPVPISLIGEPGSGKLLVARVIHHQGPTGDRGFVAVDCESLPAEAIETILFGELGLRSPRTGTVFLRRAASLPRELQDRVVEWWHTKAADAARIVAGWSKLPQSSFESGEVLREFADLFGLFLVHVPPLRERLDDLPRLAETWLHAKGKSLSAAASHVLRQYPWPGNLRELKSVLWEAADRCAEPVIDADQLPDFIRSAPSVVDRPAVDRQFPLKQTLHEIQRRLILFALRRARGRKAEAARLLDISRSELWRRMRELSLSDGDWQEEAND